MQINYKELLKEQILFMVLPVLLAVVLLCSLVFGGIGLFKNVKVLGQKSGEYKTLVEKKNDLEVRVAQRVEENKTPDAKKIFQIQGMKFGADASFAPLFDNMIAVAKESGIRIRSIDYNYSPASDPVFAAKLSGYNVCELQSTIVGNYSQIQRFLKTMLSEEYLINLAEIEIVSWKRDKSVLIANLKMRFYTQTN